MTDPTTSASALAPRQSDTPCHLALSSIQALKDTEQIARFMCSSTMVPPEFQGQKGLPNCVLALSLSARIGMDAWDVVQNIHFIHGRPSWSSPFLISMINSSGKFTSLRFVFDDEDDPSSCYCVAEDRATGETLRGTTITLEMARMEGWSTKPGSKWKTMPGQMLRYRAASFWSRAYFPMAGMTMRTREEVIDVEPVKVSTAPVPMQQEPKVFSVPPTAPAAEQNEAVEPAEVAQPEQKSAAIRALSRIQGAIRTLELDGYLAHVDKYLADGTFTEAEAEELRAAGEDRRAALVKTLPATRRARLRETLGQRIEWQDDFREAFGLAGDDDHLEAVTQVQHQLVIESLQGVQS